MNFAQSPNHQQIIIKANHQYIAHGNRMYLNYFFLGITQFVILFLLSSEPITSQHEQCHVCYLLYILKLNGKLNLCRAREIKLMPTSLFIINKFSLKRYLRLYFNGWCLRKQMDKKEKSVHIQQKRTRSDHNAKFEFCTIF